MMFAGVDGGGTQTRVMLAASDGRICGLGHAGASNVDDVGVTQAASNIDAALQDACEQAQCQRDDVCHAFFGMAGVVSASDRAIIAQLARPLLPKAQLGVNHDCYVALLGALSGREGIILIAGTGSACFGRDAYGQGWRAGGWGGLVSDEGSSYWLGQQALVAMVRDLDGRGVKTSLTGRLFAVLGIDDADEILHRLYVTGISRTEIAALAPHVIEAAASGDSVAQQLLEQGGHYLAGCVAAVLARLDLPHPCELSVVGGLTKAGAMFWQPFKGALEQRQLHVHHTDPEMPPVCGALLAAYQQAEIALPDVLTTLKHHVQNYAGRV